MIEGANDAVLFENFVYKVLMKLRSDPATAHRKIMVIAENARIHKKEQMQKIAERLGVDFMFLPQNSPWCNPFEQLFNLLKRQLRATNRQYTR